VPRFPAVIRTKKFGAQKLVLYWPRLACREPFVVLESGPQALLAGTRTRAEVITIAKKKIVKQIVAAAKGKRMRKRLSALKSVSLLKASATADAIISLMPDTAKALLASYPVSSNTEIAVVQEGGEVEPSNFPSEDYEGLNDMEQPSEEAMEYAMEDAMEDAVEDAVGDAVGDAHVDVQVGDPNDYLEVPHEAAAGDEEVQFPRRLPDEEFTVPQLKLEYSLQWDDMSSSLQTELDEFSNWSISRNQLNRGRYKAVQETTLGKQVHEEYSRFLCC